MIKKKSKKNPHNGVKEKRLHTRLYRVFNL